MNIYVFTDHINIPNKNRVNTGEINANRCIFKFTGDYDNLIKKAVFTRKDGKSYESIIVNNSCSIPADVLETTGQVVVGVYAYQVQDESYILRFSPTPSTIVITQGSYVEDVENPSTPPTPSELEELEQALAELDTKFNDYYTKTEVNNLIDTTFNNVMEGEY